MTASRAHRAGQHVKAAADATLGLLAVGHAASDPRHQPHRMADFAGGFMRRLGPRLKEHGIGRANLAAAFPGKVSAEIEEILQAVGTISAGVAAEFAHIDRLQMFEPDPHDQGDMLYTQEVYERFKRPARLTASPR
jgi:KDO2-lipid IV(A) lauroyltransferase